jgi:hypothetical protein
MREVSLHPNKSMAMLQAQYQAERSVDDRELIDRFLTENADFCELYKRMQTRRGFVVERLKHQAPEILTHIMRMNKPNKVRPLK